MNAPENEIPSLCATANLNNEGPKVINSYRKKEQLVQSENS